jgi:hypothetical protein
MTVGVPVAVDIVVGAREGVGDDLAQATRNTRRPNANEALHTDAGAELICVLL